MKFRIVDKERAHYIEAENELLAKAQFHIESNYEILSLTHFSEEDWDEIFNSKDDFCLN